MTCIARSNDIPNVPSLTMCYDYRACVQSVTYEDNCPASVESNYSNTARCEWRARGTADLGGAGPNAHRNAALERPGKAWRGNSSKHHPKQSDQSALPSPPFFSGPLTAAAACLRKCLSVPLTAPQHVCLSISPAVAFARESRAAACSSLRLAQARRAWLFQLVLSLIQRVNTSWEACHPNYSA